MLNTGRNGIEAVVRTEFVDDNERTKDDRAGTNCVLVLTPPNDARFECTAFNHHGRNTIAIKMITVKKKNEKKMKTSCPL